MGFHIQMAMRLITKAAKMSLKILPRPFPPLLFLPFDLDGGFLVFFTAAGFFLRCAMRDLFNAMKVTINKFNS